mmetsp:Transcript_47699/g.120085  ORF Transcript_47699/g.120085 Transcript_47699/m.120085 type:complete len:269 (+) Transcript_47699:56-862(+)|eukprot:CAMPEP_0177661090 /NCGR_PEP_ID=MMETSP0447-20121125/18452_1 /TAXON_ID=0 /ORGANISM="Stygamoeba regulata, Strain BSH-02190019" /LENGTH=268 /DNA_ID=CAMNT_0019166327 /DNA_START=55 /DNA_END=861 /DNA_ORIENTATION=-
MSATAGDPRVTPEQLAKFQALVDKDVDAQVEFFLKSFIFALGDDWKKVVELSKTYAKYLRDNAAGQKSLDATQAADFLQHNDATRTALERRKEVRDVDLNFDDYLDFIELALLLFKGMILTEYYKRVGEACPHDLSKGGVGVTGVGFELLDELFTMPTALSPELEKAIEEFAAQKRARSEKMRSLEEKAAGGGVRAMSAKNELAQMNAADVTEMNRLEITLNAAKRRAGKQSGEAALKEKKQQEEQQQKASREASRQRLAERAALFGK